MHCLFKTFIFREIKLKLIVRAFQRTTGWTVCMLPLTSDICSTMAEVGKLLNESKCPICLDVPKDPITTQCGHTHCKVCFNKYWDQHDQSDSCCPQCGRASTLQPVIKVTEETGREERVSPAKNDTQLCSKTDNKPPVIGKDSPSTQQSVCPSVLSDEFNVRTECADGHPEGDNSGPASEKKSKKVWLDCGALTVNSESCWNCIVVGSVWEHQCVIASESNLFKFLPRPCYCQVQF